MVKKRDFNQVIIKKLSSNLVKFEGYLKKGKEIRQAIHITPLRPITLAAFPPWGSSSGAGCMGLALLPAKIRAPLEMKKFLEVLFDYICALSLSYAKQTSNST